MSTIFHSQRYAKLKKMANSLRNSDALAKANKDPIAFFKQHQINLVNGVEYQIIVNDDKNFNFVIPHEPETELSHETMNELIAAANCLGSASTSLTAFTVSCPSSTVSSGSSVSTASTLSGERLAVDVKTGHP